MTLQYSDVFDLVKEKHSDPRVEPTLNQSIHSFLVIRVKQCDIPRGIYSRTVCSTLWYFYL